MGVYVYVSVYGWVYLCARAYACFCVCPVNIKWVCAYELVFCMRVRASVCVCVCLCMSVCASVCITVYVCLFVYFRVSVRVRMCEDPCVSMYVFLVQTDT